MRKIERTAKFKKDYKNIINQKFFDKELFKEIIYKLANDIPLEDKYKDHPLHGEYEGTRECHIKPDWLLIYIKTQDGLTLIMTRTGTHSNLFLNDPPKMVHRSTKVRKTLW